METRAEVCVVGAGIVGLAIAAELIRDGRSVVVLEREPDIARGVTSRNSEVVHAGLYYPKDSLKARLCIAGREALYERARRFRVPHRKTGKLVVAAVPDEIPALDALLERARDNGVAGLERWDEPRVQEKEPALRTAGAIFSPETGIVDARALARSFLAEAEQLAGSSVLVPEAPVRALEIGRQGARLEIRRGGADERVETLGCDVVVLAAGLDNDTLLEHVGLDVDLLGLRQHPCKGDYFRCRRQAGITLRHLVYPLPSDAGLGIHATLDLAGGLRFGPDAEYVDAPRYDVDPGKRLAFAAAVQRYLPGLSAEHLEPDYAGVRPKLAGPGVAFRDFAIGAPDPDARPGLFVCTGIESPGLTAAPAIGRHVADQIAGRITAQATLSPE